MTTSKLKQVHGFGVLRSVLESVRTQIGCSLRDLTVLSPSVDPYRLDTTGGHCDGAWAAEQIDRLIGPTRQIHLRGLHYAISVSGDVVKPDGTLFLNDHDNWEWLSGRAAKAARWLGYVPFERITDNRNAEPIVHRKEIVTPAAFVSCGLSVQIPSIGNLEPFPYATGFDARQTFQFVIFGEKASLEDVVSPIAARRCADVYLQTGEMSDTYIYRIAKDAHADGRPLVVFTVTDCDPSGHQMSVSIARKLQAFRDLFFPNLKFEVVPVALTVEQVRELGLPSTPLKETEKRADRWREAFGVEQTEIDALATLQPDVLSEIIERAFDPYYDRTLESRVRRAQEDWHARAMQALNDQVDYERIEAIRRAAAKRLAKVRDTIADINRQLETAVGDVSLPPIRVPKPSIDPDAETHALVSFDDDWLTATRAMKDRKSYIQASDDDGAAP